MPIPLAGQVAIAAAPGLVGKLNDVINPSQPSEFEKKLNDFFELYDGQARKGVTENSVYKSGKREIDARDKKIREQSANIVGAGNNTNEAKLAVMQNANDSYGAALSRLMENARRYKEFSQGKALQVAGMQENAKQNRLQQKGLDTASLIQPLSKAANAVLLSDVLGNTTGG